MKFAIVSVLGLAMSAFAAPVAQPAGNKVERGFLGDGLPTEGLTKRLPLGSGLLPASQDDGCGNTPTSGLPVKRQAPCTNAPTSGLLGERDDGINSIGGLQGSLGNTITTVKGITVKIDGLVEQLTGGDLSLEDCIGRVLPLCHRLVDVLNGIIRELKSGGDITVDADEEMKATANMITDLFNTVFTCMNKLIAAVGLRGELTDVLKVIISLLGVLLTLLVGLVAGLTPFLVATLGPVLAGVAGSALGPLLGNTLSPVVGLLGNLL